MRVVSLDPGATELLIAIGAGPMLVGRSDACDGAPGRAWDPASVPTVSPDGATLASVGADLIVARAPADAIVRVAESIRPVPRVFVRDPRTIEDMYDDALKLGRIVGLERGAMHAVVSFRERADRALEHVNPYADGPVVGFIGQTDPIRVAGLWTVQQIERAGGRHPLNAGVARPGSGSAVGPQMAERIAGPPIAIVPEIFAASRPDAIIVAPHDAPLDAAWDGLCRLAQTDWFGALPAARAGRVAAVDGRRLFHHPGPGLIDGLAFLVGWLNGREDLIPPGVAWRRWS